MDMPEFTAIRKSSTLPMLGDPPLAFVLVGESLLRLALCCVALTRWTDEQSRTIVKEIGVL